MADIEHGLGAEGAAAGEEGSPGPGEGRYEALVEGAPEAILELDLTAERFVTVNTEAERLFGRTRDELLAIGPAGLNPPDQPDGRPSERSFGEHIARALRGDTTSFAWTYRGPGGDPIPCEVRLLPLPDPARTVLSVIVADLRERLGAEEQARRLRDQRDAALEQLASILTSAGDGIYGVDRDDRVTFANPAAARMLHRTVEEMVGGFAHERWHHTRPGGEPYPQSECPICIAARDGRVRTVTGELFWTKEGSSFPVEYTCAPLVREGGIAGTVCIFRDVSERIRAERADQAAAVQAAARRAAERLQAATAALSATMSAAEVAAVSTAQAAELLGARTVEIYDASGRRLDHAGARPEHTGPPLPATDAARSAEPVWLESSAAWRKRYPDLTARSQPAEPPPTVALPLVVGDRLLGVMLLSFDGEEAMEGLDRGTLGALAEQCAQALERARLYEAEREVASTLQRSLLPPPPPAIPGVEVALRYLPAGEGLKAGGDWYDVMPLPGGRVGVAVGDVVGRGVQAAAVMGQLQSALRAFALDGDAPAAVLAKLSRFAERVEQAAMATVAYGVLEPRSGDLVYARAGHPPPLMVSPSGRAIYLQEARGVPLAAYGRVRYTEGRTRLEAGGMLVLYSDGLIERRRESLDAGLARLARAVALVAGTPTEEVCDRVLDALFSERRPADDVALLLLRRTPLTPRTFTRRIPARPEELGPLRQDLRGWMREAGLEEGTIQDLLLACGEALANAVEHAYPDGERGRVEFRVTIDDEGALRAAVRDFGRWRPPVPDPDRGRGLGLMRVLTDALDVESTQDGTRVVMLRRPRSAA